jgi:hypothetical protein
MGAHGQLPLVNAGYDERIDEGSEERMLRCDSLPPADHLLLLARLFVERKLEVWPAFRAALVVGSVAHGEARTDSDVDCILVFSPLDERIVPAEFVWVPATDTFHTIFEVDAAAVGGVQIDARRVALEEWRDQEWEDGHRHELAHAIIVSDRDGLVGSLLAQKLQYPDAVRLSRVQAHYERARYFTEEWRLQRWIERGGIAAAHDQLTAAFAEIIRLLHAYNREWLPWRYRRMVSAQKLAWLPERFAQRTTAITSQLAPTEASLQERHGLVAGLLGEIAARLQADALLADPGAAFRATHPQLGYAHTMERWRQGHEELRREREEPM